MDGDILALDLGQTTGWAVVSKYRPPVVGTMVLAAKSVDGQGGYRLNELRQRLIDKIDEIPSIAEVWYEAPWTRMGKDSSEDVVLATVGYASCAEMAAAHHRRPVSKAVLGSIRLQVFGKGSFGNRDANKGASKAWALFHGLPAHNDNVTDALALAEYAANCQGNGWSIFQTKWYGDMQRAAEADA